MVKDDVVVDPIVKEQCDGPSEFCTVAVTHQVAIEIRGISSQLFVGCYCSACAHKVADAIKLTLPEDDSQNEDGTTEDSQ